MGRKRHCLGVPSYIDICDLVQNGQMDTQQTFGLKIGLNNGIMPPNGNDATNGQNGNGQISANGGKENGSGGQHIQVVAGPQGPTGPRGEIGPTGPTGAIGPTGPQGLRGETGPIGPQGIQGEIGPTGPQGEPGVADRVYIAGTRTGEAGTPADIYDDYANNIHSLTFTIPAGPTGPKGDRGEKGEQGPKGERGERGEKGEQGPKGERGERGEKGADGDPATSAIRSINYIVAEDLAGQYYTDLQADLKLPANNNDITILTDSITINTAGTYYLAIQGYIDATQTPDATMDITAFKNGQELPETQVACLKGQFISFNRGTFQEFAQNDSLQFSLTGQQVGGSSSDLYITLIRLNIS